MIPAYYGGTSASLRPGRVEEAQLEGSPILHSLGLPPHLSAKPILIV